MGNHSATAARRAFLAYLGDTSGRLDIATFQAFLLGTVQAYAEMVNGNQENIAAAGMAAMKKAARTGQFFGPVKAKDLRRQTEAVSTDAQHRSFGILLEMQQRMLERLQELTGPRSSPSYKCASRHCPGYPVKASQAPHPTKTCGPCTCDLGQPCSKGAS